MRFIIITFLFAVIFLSSSILKAQGSQVNDQYMRDLETNIKALMMQMSKAKDPKEKIEIVKKMQYLYGAYEHPDVRLHMISKKYPKYAQRIIASRNMTAKQGERDVLYNVIRRQKISDGLLLRTEGAKSPWPLLTKDQQIEACNEAVKECLEEDNIPYCRFVVDKCKQLIDVDIYDEVKSKVPDLNRE